MAQLDVFKNDCEKATNMLILWEKANYSDRKRCLKDLENLQTPLGLEQEWEFVKTLWKSFYETHRIDVSSTPCPDSLKNLDRQIILCRSDDVRKYISNIRGYVCAEEEDDDSASVTQEETVPKEEAPVPFHKEKILPVFGKYFNFFEGFAREEDDDDGIKVYANFLADRFDKPEQTIISRFLSEEISNQTFVYGSVNAVETSETDVYDIWDCLITAKSIIIRHYHTDDEGYSDDYYAHLNWEDIYSVGQDSEYKTWVNFYDADGEEIGSIAIPMVCGHNDNKTIKKWMNILTEVVNAVHQDEKNDLLSNVVESLNSKGTSSERQGRKNEETYVSFL